MAEDARAALPAAAAAAAAAAAQSDADTIAARTRTKFSLVDVPIDTLEASLPDAALEHAAPESEEDREYQRFLSSLLPNEQENLSFLDEEDEEYRPEEEDDEHDEDDARRGISKKELTDLLLDSTHMTFPKGPAVAPPLKPSRAEVLVETGDTLRPVAAAVDEEAAAKQPVMNLTANVPVTKPAELRGQRGAVSQAQCIQLASQMHKHLQLLLQSYHLLAKGPPTPALTECRAMIVELQQRGEKALKYKNALLSKLNPGTAGAAGATTEAEVGGDKAPSSAGDPSEAEGSSGSASTTENLLAVRRVTRSLTAAHAAVAHPSMFELVGSQTVDELSAVFARGCSLEERNRAIQEQMLQLDTHLLSVKLRRKFKKGYSPTEDNLLAHGVKRFGAHPDSWEKIQKHFLPNRTSQNIRHRYKYLISSKTGMSAVKALHMKAHPQQSDTGWLLEEDLRIARGLVELHKEKYHFATLAKRYLPHRSRFEVRKRWERLAAKFRSDLSEIGLVAPEDDSLDLAVAMKEYLEDKLRSRMLRQRGEAERAKLDAALQLQQLGQSSRGFFIPPVVGKSVSNSAQATTANIQKKGHDPTFCKTKNLHPALFFSSWSFISPATLLNATCKHNWPSFMDDGNESKDKPQRIQLNTEVAGNKTSDDNSQPGDLSGQALAARDDQVQEFVPIAMPSDLSVTPTPATRLTGIKQMPQARILMEARMAQKESEEEEDDSDYEHDELLSSENEESDSDFEQMEFTDDDDEDEDGDASADTFEQDTFISDLDDQSADRANSLKTPTQSPLSSPAYFASGSVESSDSSKPSPRIRHPLRLQNLGQPGNERMKRALAALERRIVGKSVNFSAPSAVSSNTGSNKRAKRKVASTLIAPLGAARSADSTLFQTSVDERSNPTTGSDEDDNDTGDDAWEDGSGDEEFEVVELPSSSDEFASESPDEGHEENDVASPSHPSNSKAATTLRGEAPTNTSINNALPNKKAKLQQCPTCHNTTCTCSSSERMQLLLRRMKEKRSSSSLQ
ncbi:unnamed protein product [Phytophthora lilii]|uniref:Unnamed protein product n=1 Tax=Phytophthora lilii TaxID=2077276 RepID=A0A9W6UED4_9STRA|nr:unnamed protein product [Phytophthora lilii]